MNVPYASLGTHRANAVGQSHQTSACLGLIQFWLPSMRVCPCMALGIGSDPCFAPETLALLQGRILAPQVNVTPVKKDTPSLRLESFCRSLKRSPVPEMPRSGDQSLTCDMFCYNSFAPLFASVSLSLIGVVLSCPQEVNRHTCSSRHF